MVRSSLLTLTLVFTSFAAVPAIAQTATSNSISTVQKTTLVVSVSGLRNDKGQVLIQLWNGPDGFPKQSDKGVKLVSVDADKAVNGTVTATFDLAAGTYAVSTLHDENKNNKMDTSIFGIPKGCTMKTKWIPVSSAFQKKVMVRRTMS